MVKRIVSMLVVIAAALAGVMTVEIWQHIADNAVAADSPTFQEKRNATLKGLKKGAQKINDRTPYMVNKNTRLDGASVGPGLSVIYHFTFPDYSSKEIDAASLKDKLIPAARNYVCTNEGMAPSLKDGVTYIYSYFSANEVKIVSAEISQSDCK